LQARVGDFRHPAGSLERADSSRIIADRSRCLGAHQLRGRPALAELLAVAYPAGDWRKINPHRKPSPLFIL
jgi:hypothetical protein